MKTTTIRVDYNGGNYNLVNQNGILVGIITGGRLADEIVASLKLKHHDKPDPYMQNCGPVYWIEDGC